MPSRWPSARCRACFRAASPRSSCLGWPTRLTQRRGSSTVLAQSSRHAVILSCGAGLAVVATAPLIPLIYGPGFQPAVELTLVLVPGSVAYGIASVLSAGIIGQGKSWFPLFTTLVTAPLTVVAYILATKAFGATGAAVASSVSYTVTGLVAAGFWMHLRPGRARDLFVPHREDWDAYRQLLRTAVPTSVTEGLRARQSARGQDRHRALGAAPAPRPRASPPGPESPRPV